jgi:hypothetical protein
MLFVRSPHDIYYDIWSLVKHHGFTPEYVESMTPAERGLFKNYNEMEKQKANEKANADAAHAVGLDIEDL